MTPNAKTLGIKWVLKKKLKTNGFMDKYKVRLVVKGFKQKKGIYYFETFYLITKLTSLRIMFAKPQYII